MKTWIILQRYKNNVTPYGVFRNRDKALKLILKIEKENEGEPFQKRFGKPMHTYEIHEVYKGKYLW